MDAIRHAPRPVNMEHELYAFRCCHCTATFKREDHRRRHELTHAKPRYACDFPGCGMRFHRTDVLKRHEEVHLPDPNKKRRRPRRGLDPKIKDRGSGDDVSESGSKDSPASLTGTGDGICPDCGTASIVCQRCLDILFERTKLPSELREAFNFCAAHHVEFQMRRFSFIHHSTARIDWVRNGRLLAMAALAGIAIREYREASKQFFDAALRSFSSSPTMNIYTGPCRVLDIPSRSLLTSFQTRMMLIEYGLWSNDHLSTAWALEELNKMTISDAKKVVDIYRAVSSRTDKSRKVFLLEEEICRTAWAFYCLLIRASIVFNLALSVPEALKSVRLPGSEIDFNMTAAEELDGFDEDLYIPLAVDVSFQHALFLLLAERNRYHPSLTRISPLAQYIMAHALMEQYDLALNAPHNYPDIDAFSAKSKLQFQPQERFWSGLDVWNDHFRVKSEDHWMKALPESFAQIQSNLILDYLTVRMTDADKRSSFGDPRLSSTIERVTTMTESMAICGVLDVATRAHWMCDRASWWYACRMAKAQYLWAIDAGRAAEAGQLAAGCPEVVLLERIAEVVKRMRRDSGNELPPGICAMGLSRVSLCVKKMWTLLLGTSTWLE